MISGLGHERADGKVGEAAIATVLVLVGEDPGRPELVDTPRRAVAYVAELTAGYRDDTGPRYLTVAFEEDYDEMAVLSGSVSPRCVSTTCCPSPAPPSWVMCLTARSSGCPSWSGWWRRAPGGSSSRNA